MARKQARRRKHGKVRLVPVPKLRVGRIIAPCIVVVITIATYHVSGRLLDRPIQSIEISGPFQRVTALQIEEAISDELEAGFLGTDLSRMQALIQGLQWIDQASVARRWPNRIAVAVSEQAPAAVWGERGLLNVRGELFVRSARHVPAELPQLSGPESRSTDVAKRYLEVREKLIPIGLDLRQVHLDARGAWRMTLQNGLEVRLGRREIDERIGLFVDVVASIITGHAADIEYVDMRYSNGFTIGWKNGSNTPIGNPQQVAKEMLASRGSP
jgi:cell division protein FtsQ